jgi:hypothetical protein
LAHISLLHLGLHALHVDEWLRVLVLLQHCVEKWAAGSQDVSVGLNLLVLLTHQGHIGEVCVFTQGPEGTNNVVLELIPLEAKLFKLAASGHWSPPRSDPSLSHILFLYLKKGGT